MGTSSIDRISPVLIGWHDSSDNPHSHSSDSYGKRIVEHYELEYIVSSYSGYIFIDEIPVPTVPGNIFFRFPGMVVEGIGVYHSLFIEFDMNAEGERLEEEESLAYCCGKGFPSCADETLFYSLKPGKDASLVHAFRTKAQILLILSRLAELNSGKTAGRLEGAQLQKVKKALHYVQLHYAENITEAELAAASGYSDYYFCRLFKRVTQLTPMQYVVRYRIERARTRLLSTNDSMETIMEKTGFRHYSYFWRTFKEIYGCSPGDYRKSFAKNESDTERSDRCTGKTSCGTGTVSYAPGRDGLGYQEGYRAIRSEGV